MEADDQPQEPKHPLELQEELVAMPEWISLERVRHWGLSIRLFEKNYEELARLLRFLTIESESVEMLALTKRSVLSSALEEVVRLLHNFVASAQSLVDHSRVAHHDLYRTSNSFPDYQQEVSRRFATSPLIQFVHCLRQFAQHYRLPHIAIAIEFDKATGMRRRLYLTMTDLQAFRNWNAPAKRFLDEAGDQIDLVPLIESYRIDVRSFYEWISSRQQDLHRRDFEAVSKRQDEFSIAVAPHIVHSIEIGLLILERDGVGNIQDVFAMAFSGEDFANLAQHDIPSAWTNAAIELIESRFGPLPVALVERLRSFVGQ